MKKPLLLILIPLFFSCNRNLFVNSDTQSSPIISKQTEINQDDLKNWSHKSLKYDTIPGISLEEAYDKLLDKKLNSNDVVVAVLDTEIDINHEDLAGKIWINEDELPNNGIDDDNNGYIDDRNGWNYLVNKNGESLKRTDYEFVRIIKKFDSIFSENAIDNQISNQNDDYLLYLKAKEKYNQKLQSAKKDQEYGDFLNNNYPKAKKLLLEYFPDGNYTFSQVDSLYNIYKNDNAKGKLIYFMYDYLRYNLTETWIKEYKKNADARLQISLNLNNNPRKLLNDKENLNKYDGYGSPLITKNIGIYDHGTYVAGVIAANRNNDLGIQGIYDKAIIMPLNISTNGDEYDKDIALAITYAVDNGADIINMSFAKEFSMNEEFIDNALKYAASKDVLIVGVASNESINIDNNSIYPNDYDQDGNEIVDNFIVVGSISHHLDENFKSYFSNYGKQNVDIFAPGDKIYTLKSKNEYLYQSGTSMSAPMVSGLAALLKGYYPSLKAKQIKKIIMESGVQYNIDIKLKNPDGSFKFIPFKDLSKSGKVINAYNALLMAEELSKN